MKTHHIEVRRLKAARQAHGLVEFAVDVQLSPQAPAEGSAATSVLSLTEANARVLQSLLKAQLAEIDGKKARSQR